MGTHAIPFNSNGRTDAMVCDQFWRSWSQFPRMLRDLGDALWLEPIRRAAEYYAAIDNVDLRSDNRETFVQYFYYFTMMIYRHPYEVRNRNWLPIHIAWLRQDPLHYISNHRAHYEDIRNNMCQSLHRLVECHLRLRATILLYINFLRRMLVSQMIQYKKDNKATQSSVPKKDHPIFLLAGVGDSADLIYGPQNLISSNDITGLIVKLKTVYMRAAYAQLIQTLSQMAEKKLYKTITFRQDEIKEILTQIKKLSADTFHQLKVEDRLINSMAMKIIKMVDPNVDVEKTENQLALDLGEYPPRAFRVVSTARD